MPTQLPVAAGESADDRAAAAATLRPSPAQLAWQAREVTVFTHLGMNTLTDREWGSGCEDPATFAPPVLDVEQWMDVHRSMGAAQAMLTAKHHDGFCLWPSRYTDHTIARSGAPAGADLVRAYTDTARAAGLRAGVYLSPADGAELPHAWHAAHSAALQARVAGGEGPRHSGEESTLADAGRAPGGRGRYGNGSAKRTVTLPTLVEGDDRAERVASGELPSFTFELDDYNAFYLNQVYEILTQYGPFDEFWLDGANPWREHGIEQPYDFTAWFTVIRALAPDAVIFGGPDGVRWVGNEDGIARETEWSTVPATDRPDAFHGEWLLPDYADRADLASREKLADPRVSWLRWFPAESDVSIRPGWFHHPSEKPKSAAELLDLYEKSVGRNSLLLLNVPPAADGRIAEEDAAECAAFGALRTRVYGTDLGAEGQWDSAELRLPEAVAFDRVRLAEDLAEGQRVESCVVEARSGDDAPWTEVASATTVGHARILPLAEPVTADRLRVRVTATRAEPVMLRPTLHRRLG
ncbi:alpha-L-fucosidase [Mangrovactinospora gilvigrisea]|uniref:alpha-L-fucosidase n=1 Tax=Mangrovactinospora gilvigrisea TaxID=1428644 RepID=A0A1J7C4U9_9ACTN|nr:alpha-L-fucosidase [Mangrovactinospora gilvigrisea]OIV36580.1 alpha-L-fucosidase [Mangrovactinospora gilvigrisea]